MKRNTKHSGESTRLAVGFFVLVFIFIITSLLFRAGILVANSKYDSDSRFTIELENGKDLRIISISGKSKSLSLFEITGDIASLNLKKFLAIPIDGSIGTSLDIKEEKIENLFGRFILSYNNLETNLTIIDLSRLYLAIRAIPAVNIRFNRISSSLDEEKIDKQVVELFKDEEIEREKVAVRIVNTTSVNGLGARLGRLISNMGGNVLLVESEDKKEAISTISYFGKKNYTVEKLEKVLGYKAVQITTKIISDVVVTIGDDSEDTSVF